MTEKLWRRTPPTQTVKRYASNKENSGSDEKLRAPWAFCPVDARLASGQTLLGGTFAIIGQGQVAWTGRQQQRTVLGEGRDNADDHVVLRMDYTAARLVHVEACRLSVGSDVFAFRTPQEAEEAAALLTGAAKVASATRASSSKTQPGSRRRRSLDLETIENEFPSPKSAPRSPASPQASRRNALSVSPNQAELLRKHVREYVRSNSDSSVASILSLVPNYSLERVAELSNTPPRYSGPSQEQLRQLRPLVTLMAQRAAEDKKRLQQGTRVVVQSPNAKAGRSCNTFVDVDTGLAISPGEYERRYRALEAVPRHPDIGVASASVILSPTHATTSEAAVSEPRQPGRRSKEDLVGNLEALTRELHAAFDVALEDFFSKKTALEQELNAMGETWE